jgi:hypothetical protein
VRATTSATLEFGVLHWCQVDLCYFIGRYKLSQTSYKKSGIKRGESVETLLDNGN